ncbi:precorrin-6y C5,15-methyltransferase (decarboxylating) subunit CbiE [Acuticoccus sp. MNP-M23]|uniref:precorrin-6y C5,15-methyltransferase (decarboxylating) subunit CbiE n=1 Tax=Acuticoccus sp. MNP-M23 TaxID=3072793 RepID=UPI00281694BA|nr:precorrin-6y C5,15-methyltransferase (decarboxylating) subunit CbiE [Acuticoccus sp. MNP-M23]WMS43280.1 precorrin-6y C5,15-methyltransferase (decarboxylating) subunit CbiE [Acuticoccus sp. MNP-M23]
MSEAARPWLTIVGIGEDGVAGLGENARAAISAADLVVGGARHLALAAPLIGGRQETWPKPFSLAPVLSRRGEAVCVLASGDPFWHGVGALLAREVPVCEMRVFAGQSAFAMAAQRMGWAMQNVVALSLHGLPVARLRPHLSPGRRILALTSDENGPAEMAALATRHGFGDSALTVLEALGGPAEAIRRTTAASFDLSGLNPLNVVALDVVGSPGAAAMPLSPGLPDDWFAHDGQITKREARALAISALAPLPGEILWDIGAGAGSVAIEWMLRDASLGAFAIEAVPERAARIVQNAEALGVPSLRLVEGRAPEALAGLPPPDAVFVGGGASNPAIIDAALAALRPGGRLVVHAVTLETEAVLLACHARLGGSLTRLEIARASAVGRMHGWRPAMPVTQWVYAGKVAP